MRWILFVVLLLLIAGPAAAQGNTGPQITRFFAHRDAVLRSELADGTARVPVSWDTANRLETMNLAFEQVLPDGSVVNVELPRDIPWVSSSGQGMAAPVDPGSGATQVELQVRLYVFGSGETLDSRTLTLEIVDLPEGEGPRITLFSTTARQVTAVGLRAGTERVPVVWDVAERPANSNLYFEQVLPGGDVINVELPRDNPWVSSSGWGVMAPVAPAGPNATEVTLRVALRDMTSGVFYSDYHITLPIVDAAPALRINSFTVSPTFATEGDPITVSWEVSGTDVVSVAARNYPGEPRFGPPSRYASSGSTTLTAPYGVREFNVVLWAAADVEQSVTVRLDCRFEWFGAGGQHCPEAAASSEPAVYQAFEHGYMLMRQDSDRVWIYFDSDGSFHVRPTSHPWWVTGDEVDFTDPAPEGRFRPAGVFGRIWGNDAWFRDNLGWALAPEQNYSMTYQQTPWAAGTGLWRFRMFTLPDGSVMASELGEM